MRILASAAHKGGVGKTTLAAHLAVEAERVGAGPVVLLDTDPQESLTDWHKVRVPDHPTLLSPTLKTLPNMIAELRARGAALAIVDTPPGSRVAISAALAVADLVLIPAQPSPIDFGTKFTVTWHHS